MIRLLRRVSMIFLVSTILVGWKPTIIFAQYVPAEQVTLTLYRLVQEGPLAGSIALPPTPCTKDDPTIARSYGCTAITGRADYAYPFETSTITIGIDGTGGPDNARYPYPYLWDVVPQELDMNGSQGNKPLSAVAAQAIAARTYIYQRITYIDQYGAPNNSTQFHVFLPYRYALLTAVQQERVQAATASRAYMTEPGGAYPIEALYGADNPAATVEGNRPYLQSVSDPISAAYGVLDGAGNGGMSSKGASRWSFGHTSSRGPVAAGDALYPHDINGLGEFWSVRWDDAFQILTHYYTGIHVRDANNPAAVLTPDDRWVPLDLTMPTAGCLNRGLPVAINTQNSGVSAWEVGTEVKLGYRLIYRGEVGPSAAEADEQAAHLAETASVGPGRALSLPFIIKPEEFQGGQGRYLIRFDLYRGGQSFASLAAAQGKHWLWLEREVALYDCPAPLFVPLVMSSPVSGEPAH